MQLDEIKEKVRVLGELMKQPEPGISSWVGFLRSTVGELNELVNPDLRKLELERQLEDLGNLADAVAKRCEFERVSPSLRAQTAREHYSQLMLQIGTIEQELGL